jgi:hypothetical protein
MDTICQITILSPERRLDTIKILCLALVLLKFLKTTFDLGPHNVLLSMYEHILT